MRGVEGINPGGGPVQNFQKPSNRLNGRIPRLVVILAGTVLAATSCGGDDGGSGATTPSPATSVRTGDAASGTVINVDERDFTIELSTMEFTPGTYTFVTTNSGQTVHALEIEGPGLEEETADLAPGESAELSVTLEAGEYELYCPVGNHRDMGMKLDITVE
jgi:plastocyanin